MKITESQMSEMFKELNEQYFDGQLDTPNFRVVHTMDALGLYCHDTNGNEIRITDVYDRDDRSYRQTMLHEMIHQKIDQFRLKDNSEHGKVFMNEAARLNDLGWDITPVSDSSSFSVNEGTTKKRSIYIFLVIGKVMAVAADRGGEKTVEAVLRKYGARNIKHIFTDDPMFARLPPCRVKLKGITLTEEMIEKVNERFDLNF